MDRDVVVVAQRECLVVGVREQDAAVAGRPHEQTDRDVARAVRRRAGQRVRERVRCPGRVVERQRVPGLCQLRQVQVVGAAAEETLLDRKKTRVARSAGNVRHIRRRLVERHVVVGQLS